MAYPFQSDASRERLLRLQAGAMSPLWLPFLFAASVGVAAWVAGRWVRGEFAATLPYAPAKPVSAAAEPVPSPADLMPGGAIDAPLPPADNYETTVAPMLAAEAATVSPTEPLPPRVADADLGEEPGGKAGLLAETSAAALSSLAIAGGDVRAEEAAEATPPVATDTSADDAGADAVSLMADAAYADNLGPVPVAAKKSRKRKSPPGTAPAA